MHVKLDHQRASHTLTCGIDNLCDINFAILDGNLTRIVCINKTPGPAEISLHGIVAIRLMHLDPDTSDCALEFGRYWND